MKPTEHHLTLHTSEWRIADYKNVASYCHACFQTTSAQTAVMPSDAGACAATAIGVKFRRKSVLIV
jgi:hypothetical protein